MSAQKSPLPYLDILKSTVIVNGRLAINTERYATAIRNEDARQVMAIEHVAARLAGGMLQMIDILTLRQLVAEVVQDIDLGELNAIKTLPGFAKAAAASLMKFWMSGLEPQAIKASRRMDAILQLEETVLERMPLHLKRPVDLRNLALERAHLGGRILGRITIKGMTDLHPVWRPIIEALAKHSNPATPLEWEAGPRRKPDWVVQNNNIKVITGSPQQPSQTAITCANARHEVVEALRWVRKLLLQGVDGADIAIATTNTDSYDDIIAAAAEEAEIDIHIAHGISCIHRAEGQKCAALADILLRGLSQKKVRRLVDLCKMDSELLRGLPDDWSRHLKAEAALTTMDRWDALCQRPMIRNTS